MKVTRSSRLLLAATTTMLLASPVAASAQTADDCAGEGQGSAIAEPATCDFEPDVLPTFAERPDDEPLPAPVPEAVPEVLPETLTATGVDSGVLALGALGMLAAGGTALLVSRRRGGQDV